MALNKVQLIGNLGADPETRRLNNGDTVCSLRVATTDRWRDKSSGEQKEKTEWHTVVIYNQDLAKLAEDYLRKGSKAFFEGKLQTRSWEKDGEKRYTTEIVMAAFNGTIELLDKKDDNGGGGRRDDGGNDRGSSGSSGNRGGGGRTSSRDLDDEIPFAPEWR